MAVKKIRGFTPRRGNLSGRKRKVEFLPKGDDLLLNITNEHGSWSTDIVLEPDEVALAAKALVEHLEAVALRGKIEKVTKAS